MGRGNGYGSRIYVAARAGTSSEDAITSLQIPGSVSASALAIRKRAKCPDKVCLHQIEDGDAPRRCRKSEWRTIACEGLTTELSHERCHLLSWDRSGSPPKGDVQSAQQKPPVHNAPPPKYSAMNGTVAVDDQSARSMHARPVAATAILHAGTHRRPESRCRRAIQMSTITPPTVSTVRMMSATTQTTPFQRSASDPSRTLRTMQQPIILHIDMNSYFASVEQQANPFLRGKPVAVCANLTPNGCIVASSKEAKVKGIKTGCRVLDAKFLDPNVVLIAYDSDKYRTTTRKIFSLLARFTDRIEPYSIDEAFLDLTGYVHSFAEAERLGSTLQQNILAQVGEWLNCSIGIAETRWLAKFAGDTAPKGTVLLLRNSALPEYLKKFRLIDAWGINVRMERRLQRLGIFTLNDLRCADPTRLMPSLGKLGYYLWANVNGIEIGGVQDEQQPKSIGHSHVLIDRRDRFLPHRVLAKLCEKTGRRLRAKGLEAHGIAVWFSFLDDWGFNATERTVRGLYDTNDIFKPAAAHLQPCLWDHVPLSLAVTVFDLIPRSRQQSLFDNVDARDDLSRSLDRINDRYGDFTVYRGSMWGTERHAPDRVGFRKTLSVMEYSNAPVDCMVSQE